MLQSHPNAVQASQPGQARPLHHSSRRCRMVAAAGGGGLFGGLKKALGAGPQQQQQQQQQQRQQQQQQSPASQPLQAEFPPYQVLKKGDVYDLRFYDVFPVVEADYQRREEGYQALGSYSDGANASGCRFNLTQPVVMSYRPFPHGRKVMQTMVGSPRQPIQQQQPQQPAAGIADLPAPSNPAVRLGVSGGEVVAVMPFEGYITPDTAAAVLRKLSAALEADGLALGPDEAEGYVRIAQYGQVYTLGARLNELMLRVQI